MKILITGGGFENKGAEAMLMTVRQQMDDRIADIEWYAEVQDIESAEYYGIRVVYPVWPQGWWLNTLMRVAWVSRRFPSFVCNLLNSAVFPLALWSDRHPDRLIGMDGIIDVSGYAYHEGTLPRLIRMALVLREMRQGGRCVFYLPQAYGPFNNRVSRWWIQTLQKQGPQLYSRDSVSTRYLTRAGIPPEEISEAPDIALIFRGDDASIGKKILDKAGCFHEPNRPLIGISVNIKIFERTAGEGIDNQYVQTIQSLILYIIDHLDGYALLIPNEIHAESDAVDDRHLNLVIMSGFEASDSIIVLDRKMTAAETKAVIANLDYLVASRFHSLVFALSYGVPVLALGWSHKYHELLQLFDLEEFCLSHESFELAHILSLFNQGWSRRKEMREKIESNLPQLQTRVHAVFDQIAESFKRSAAEKLGS
jgi:polysaccharide pyruvyl transferase WcaK-like protein